MIETILSLADFDTREFVIFAIIVLMAGIVRGFSGFALSALVMASAVIILPPVALIPICWWLEMAASVLMLKGGWKEADKRVAFSLALFSAVGVPLGLMLTTSLPVETSKIIALTIIAVLAATQLARLKIPFLATRAGLYSAGLIAGIASGLASVGGMVVALFVLSRNAHANQMRASLVLFLFIGSFTSMITLLLFGVMDQIAVARGLLFVPIVMVGVLIGQALFTPRLAGYYRPFCLTLLCGLAAFGLVRTILL